MKFKNQKDLFSYYSNINSENPYFHYMYDIIVSAQSLGEIENKHSLDDDFISLLNKIIYFSKSPGNKLLYRLEEGENPATFLREEVKLKCMTKISKILIDFKDSFKSLEIKDLLKLSNNINKLEKEYKPLANKVMHSLIHSNSLSISFFNINFNIYCDYSKNTNIRLSDVYGNIFKMYLHLREHKVQKLKVLDINIYNCENNLFQKDYTDLANPLIKRLRIRNNFLYSQGLVIKTDTTFDNISIREIELKDTMALLISTEYSVLMFDLKNSKTMYQFTSDTKNQKNLLTETLYRGLHYYNVYFQQLNFLYKQPYSGDIKYVVQRRNFCNTFGIEKFVNSHIRRLPKGRHISKANRDRCETLGLNIPMGYTYVSGFIVK